MLKREQQRSYLVSDLKGNVSVLTSERDAGGELCTHPATSTPQRCYQEGQMGYYVQTI